MDLGVILWPVRGVFGPGGRSGSIFFEVEIRESISMNIDSIIGMVVIIMRCE